MRLLTPARSHGRTGEASGQESDRWCIVSSLTIGVIFGILAMSYSLWLYHVFFAHRLRGANVWWAPGDVWNVIDAGRYVWHGALGYVYQSSNSYALPLSFIISAPVAALVDHFHLVEALVPIPRPSAWYVVGPYTLLFGVFLLDAVRRMAWELGMRRRLLLLQLLAVVVVLAPGYEWGHFEDVLALSFVIHAARYLLAKDHLRAALLLSLAVSSKQWALMLIPFLVFLAPHGRRIMTLAAASAIPLLLTAIVLIFGGHRAFEALFSPLNLGRTAPGHISFYVTWFGDKTSQWSRTVGVLSAVPISFIFRRVTSAPRILAVMSLLLLVRPFSEAINYSYYWSPGLVLAGAAGLAAHGRFRVRDWVWQVPTILWTLPHGNPNSAGLWWGGQMVFLCLVYLQVGRNCGLIGVPARWARALANRKQAGFEPPMGLADGQTDRPEVAQPVTLHGLSGSS